MSKLEVVMEEMTNAQLVRLDKRIDGQVYFFFFKASDTVILQLAIGRGS